MAEAPFEGIKRIWIEEKSARELVDLPDEFYSNVAKHVAELNREAARGEPMRQELLKEELQHVLQMVQEIHALRVMKAINKFAEGRPPASLLERERYAFNEIRQMLEKLYTELVVPAISGETAVTAPREITNVALICLTDVPQIVGDDMKNYGPFRGGEVGFLPRRSAELLIKHGLARKIEAKLS